jgi:hypothetical protein
MSFPQGERLQLIRQVDIVGKLQRGAAENNSYSLAKKDNIC